MREGEFGSGRDGNRSRGDTIDFDVQRCASGHAPARTRCGINSLIFAPLRTGNGVADVCHRTAKRRAAPHSAGSAEFLPAACASVV
jgi:hypothetical protein